MSKEKSPEINLKQLVIDGREACEVTISGDMFTLYSMLYTAMLSKPEFADIVISAASCYLKETNRQAMLN